MANGIPSVQNLAILINAKTGGLVTEVKAANESMLALATAEEREALAAAKVTAAKDAEAAAIAKVQLATAKASGDQTAITSAQKDYTALLNQSNISKAEAAAKTQALKVAELEAAQAAEQGAASAGAFGGVLKQFGLDGAAAGDAVVAALTKIGPLLAVFAAFKVLKDGVQGFVELGNQIRGFQLITQTSAEKASLLVGQVKALGIDPDQAARSLNRLGAAIGDGTTKLGQFGIQVSLTKSGNVDLVQTFENLRKAYNDSTDAATRDAIAKQVGLRGGTQLVPLLALTTQQIRDLNAATRDRGGIFSQDDVNNAYQLKVSSAELKLSVQQLEISLSKGVVPALLESVKDTTQLLDLFNKIGSIHLPGTNGKSLFESVIGTIPGVGTTQQIHSVVNSIEQVFGARKEDTKAAAEQTVAQQAAAQAAQQEADAEDKLQSALLGQVDAMKSVRDAANQYEDAQYNLTKAQKDYDEYLATGGIDVNKEKSAYDSLVSAADSVTSALDSEQRAQDALNKARQKATELDLEEAQNKLALAGDSIISAEAARQQAGEKLSQLAGSGSATAGEIAAAQAEVKTRTDEVTKAILDQKKAQVDLQTTKNKGTDADPAVIAAQDALRSAHDSVARAITNENRARDKMIQAEQPDPAFNDTLAQKAHDLARAHQAVADAQDNRTRAAIGLKGAEDKLNASVDGQAQALGQVEQQISTLAGQGLDVSALVTALAEATGLSIERTLSSNPVNAEQSPAYTVPSATAGRATQRAQVAGSGPTVVVNNNVSTTSGATAPDIAREITTSTRTTLAPKLRQS